MDEINFIKEAAPYLIPFFGVLFLVIFVKRYLFTGMMSTETYREQMERERLVLLHYTNITSQLDDIIKLMAEGRLEAKEAAHKLGDLATSIDESIVNQILRLSPEERAIIKDLRNRAPLKQLIEDR
jgi:hypothetical protein